MGDNEKLMCLDCEYFTLIDIEQAEAYPWCDAHNKRVLPTDYCQYFTKHDGEMTTNEEKAKELGIKYQTPCHGIGDCEFEASQAALEMAQWKDEQHAWQKIPKDKDGFYDDLKKNLYDELPIIVMNKYDDGLYPSFEYICKDNWCDAVSDLSKPSYQYYMKIQEIPINE